MDPFLSVSVQMKMNKFDSIPVLLKLESMIFGKVPIESLDAAIFRVLGIAKYVSEIKGKQARGEVIV